MAALLLALMFGVTLWAGYRVDMATDSLIFSDIEALPDHHAALVLGTSKTLKSGKTNGYFSHRMQAAAMLYHAGKIKKIVVSGDNSRKDYNEPEEMRQALMELGVEPDNIYMDYAGFRTFDSIIRMREIFGQHSFTIISQEFHARRAVYIAQSQGMQTVGFIAQDVSAYNGLRTRLREKLARVKLMTDLAFGVKPKFLGEKVAID